MCASVRFECPSVSLSSKALLQRTRRTLYVGVGLAIAVHAALTQLRGLSEEQKVAKPLTTHFVKRQPRLTKPLELKKRPQPKRRQTRREMVAAKAQMQRGEQRVQFQPTQVLRGLARPNVQIGRLSRFEGAAVEPVSIAQAIRSTKEDKQKVDMSLELLDVEALNTGEHHAMVVQDPTDKRNVKGFCRLAVVHSPTIYPPRYPSFEDYVMPAFLNLANAMNQYTHVRTDIMGRITLNSAELMKTPWVYFMAFWPFDVTDSELENLGAYMLSGGFLFADGHPPLPTGVGGYQSGYQSLRARLLDALKTQGVECAYEALPNYHPVYHCYFDFDSGPPAAADGACIHSGVRMMEIIDHLDGLTVGERLLVILSQKGYYSPWANWGSTGFGSKGYADMDPTRQLQLGVNTIIFALTQEGSITHRLMESIE